MQDKSTLPSILQKRKGDFGKKGQSKHTHLTNEDTTNLNPLTRPDESLMAYWKRKTGGYKGAYQSNVWPSLYLPRRKPRESQSAEGGNWKGKNDITWRPEGCEDTKTSDRSRPDRRRSMRRAANDFALFCGLLFWRGTRCTKTRCLSLRPPWTGSQRACGTQHRRYRQ